MRHKEDFCVAQYCGGKFVGVLAGMGRNKGIWDSNHGLRSAQRHAAKLRKDPKHNSDGNTYKVESSK